MAEPEVSAASPKTLVQVEKDLLGWELDPAKSEGMAPTIDVLGCRPASSLVVPSGR